MSLPLVSAICPTFNRPRFLTRAIELFEAQTYPNKQLIIIDDSVPKQPKIDRPDIIHHQLDERMWTVPKYSVAFDLADGTYFCTWDDDDWHGPTRLEHQVGELERGILDACGYRVGAMVSLPGPRFVCWKKETTDRWREKAVGEPVPFHDGSAMWRSSWYSCLSRETWRGTQLSWFATMRDAYRGELAALPNTGQFLYVRHPHCGWNFEVDALCEPAERPAFVTEEMMEFWADDSLLKEGAA